MAFDNDRLFALKQQIIRKSQLADSLRDLNEQRDSLRTNVFQLKSILVKKQNDVDNLEESGMKTFFYGVIGKLDDKLNKKLSELKAAKQEYDTVSQKLDAITEQIKGIEAELYELRYCEQDYRKLLDEKIMMIKDINHHEVNSIYDFEYKITALGSELNLIKDTIKSGESSKESAEHIIALEKKIEKHERTLMYVHYENYYIYTKLQKEIEICNVLIKTELQILQDRLHHFKDYLEMILEFAGKYDDINIFPRFIDWYFENGVLFKSVYVDGYLRNVNPILNMLTRILCSIENEYILINDKFENFVLQIEI